MEELNSNDDVLVSSETKNMKTVYVTLKEFLENGGKLVKGREVYSEDKYSNYSMIGTYKMFDEDSNIHLIENTTYKSFPVLESVFYVKIEAKPIYV